MTYDQLIALSKVKGASGFDYATNASGDIDWYRFHFEFQNTTPQVVVELTTDNYQPTTELVYDLIPHPNEQVDPTPFQNIPQAMRDVQRWSIWQKQLDGQKIPYKVLKDGSWLKSERCRSDTPRDWVSFDAALYCYLKSNGHLCGLSFALGDEWCGFDFDNIIVNGIIHPQADSWLQRLGGYRELSQSEKGKKTFLTAAQNEYGDSDEWDKTTWQQGLTDLTTLADWVKGAK